MSDPTSDPTPGVHEETIRLDQFLKLAQAVPTGGQAKWAIRNGDVRVNGVVETRRGRKLRPGDHVEVYGEELIVEAEAGGADEEAS